MLSKKEEKQFFGLIMFLMMLAIIFVLGLCSVVKNVKSISDIQDNQALLTELYNEYRDATTNEERSRIIMLVTKCHMDPRYINDDNLRLFYEVCTGNKERLDFYKNFWYNNYR